MDLDCYYDKINRLSKKSGLDGDEFYRYFDELLIKKSMEAKELIEFAGEYYLSHDKKKYAGLLDSGYFQSFDGEVRILAFLICMEANWLRKIERFKCLCEKYCENQLLFTETNLLEASRDNELVDINEIKFLDGFDYVEVCELGYAKINDFLDHNIISRSIRSFPNARMYVRLNHHEFYKEKPLQRLDEEVVRPPNPQWVSNLKIHKNNAEGASYFIDKPDLGAGVNAIKSVDYYRRGIRKLQVCVKRNSGNNLSMLIEELSEEYLDDLGLLVGRCIHLDTDAEYGESRSNAILNHLDLAVNFYDGIDCVDRQNRDISHEEMVKASFRTHLFRIEGIPFNSLVIYVRLFLSEYLACEWLRDQFGTQKD